MSREGKHVDPQKLGFEFSMAEKKGGNGEAVALLGKAVCAVLPDSKKEI